MRACSLDEIPEEAISFYDSGSFTDMCEGPHVPDTSWLTAVRVLSVSGARANAARSRTIWRMR